MFHAAIDLLFPKRLLDDNPDSAATRYVKIDARRSRISNSAVASKVLLTENISLHSIFGRK